MQCASSDQVEHAVLNLIATDESPSAQSRTAYYRELELIGLHDNPPMEMQDPPVHNEFRKLASHGFTPGRSKWSSPRCAS